VGLFGFLSILMSVHYREERGRSSVRGRGKIRRQALTALLRLPVYATGDHLPSPHCSQWTRPSHIHH